MRLTLGAVSFIIAVIWGKPLIALLKRWRMGKQIRIEGPEEPPVQDGHAHHGRHSLCGAGAVDYGRAQHLQPVRAGT